MSKRKNLLDYNGELRPEAAAGYNYFVDQPEKLTIESLLAYNISKQDFFNNLPKRSDTLRQLLVNDENALKPALSDRESEKFHSPKIYSITKSELHQTLEKTLSEIAQELNTDATKLKTAWKNLDFSNLSEDDIENRLAAQALIDYYKRLRNQGFTHYDLWM